MLCRGTTTCPTALVCLSRSRFCRAASPHGIRIEGNPVSRREVSSAEERTESSDWAAPLGNR